MIRASHKVLKDIVKIYGTNLKEIDLTDISMAEQDLTHLKFKKDRNLFQKIKDKSLFASKLPAKDYSRYNFNGVLLKKVCFKPNTYFPKDKNLFKKVKNKDISDCQMPNINYNFYNFEHVNIKGTYFPEDCFLSENYNFFRKIKYKDFTKTKLPNHMIKNLALYDLYDTKFNITDYNLSLEQQFIIHNKMKKF